MNTLSTEMKSLLGWLGNPPRSPKQIHGINESDCECLQLGPNSYLSTTTDSISDEIAVGLYRDPYTMGWVTAQASLSDLAATGSQPLGLLFSTQWASSTDDVFKQTVSEGFCAALISCNTYLLGGDNGSASSTVLSGVGIGISERRPISRLGIQPGDLIAVTGRTGRGPALAFRLLRGESSEEFPESLFRPQARISSGRNLSKVARAMMDTSDGLISTLSTLKHLNAISLNLIWNPGTLDALAAQYCMKRNLPQWLLWVGEHGDFELVVAIPPEHWEKARSLDPSLQLIGMAGKPNLSDTLEIHSEQKVIDLNAFRTLDSGRSPDVETLASALGNLIRSINNQGLP